MSYYSDNQRDWLCAIGSRIQDMRTKKGATQDEFSTYMGVPRSTVAKWENGAQDFKSEAIDRMASYFGCSIDYLIRGASAENYDIYAATGLVDAAIDKLGRKKSIEDDFGGNGTDTIPMINVLLSDDKYYELLQSFASLRADWMQAQAALDEQRKAAKNASPRSEAWRYANAAIKELSERAEFLLWRYEHSLDEYVRKMLAE